MAFSPIAFVAPNYRDFKNYWVKPYDPGTTTPKPFALESGGGTQVAKLEINKDGFLESAGGALVIPYIDGAYDLWMFPTEAEADVNDTSSALRIADDIIGVNGAIIANTVISKHTLSEAVALLTAVDGQIVQITDRDDGQFTYLTGQTPNTFNIIAADATGLDLVLRQHPDNTIDMYGAVGGQNSSSAINAALAVHTGRVKMNGTDYILDAQLDVVSGPCTGIQGNGEIDSRMNKAFNGNVIIINNQGTLLSDFWIQGDGVNFTGGGVYVQADDFNAPRFRCTDTADSCIIFKAGSSTFGNVDNSFLLPTDSLTTYAIRSDGDDASPAPSARTFNAIKGGGSLVNFAGMNRATLTNSFGIRVGFSSAADKIYMSGNRLTNTTSDVTVLGNSHVLTGNHWGFATGFNLIFDASISHVKYDNSNLLTINGAANSVAQNNAVTGDVGTTNSIFQEIVGFTPTWQGATTDATLGNATINSFYSISERQCTFSLDFIRGSTTVNPVGTWSWTMPFKASVTSSNSILVKSSANVWFSATAFIGGSSNQMFITLNGSDGPMDESDLVFSTGAQIKGAITFEMAGS